MKNQSIKNEILLGLCIEMFQLDGLLPYPFNLQKGKPSVIPEELQKIIEKVEAITRILFLEGVIDEDGEFLHLPNNPELEKMINECSDVYTIF